MINTLEYDAMRSPGKTKLNAGVLCDLLKLEEHYSAKLAPPRPASVAEQAVAEVPVKRGPGRPKKILS